MKFFYKIFLLLILFFSFNCSIVNEKKDEKDEKDEKNNISTIVGKWRCVNYINDFLGENKNSIYIFKDNNSGIHVTYSFFDGTGILKAFNWQISESTNKKSLELNYSTDTIIYDYYFDGNKLIFDGIGSFINIYSDNIDFNNFSKEIEVNNNNDLANNILINGTHIYGELESGDIDCYTFTGRGGYNYYVNVDFLTGDNCNLCINWYQYIYYSDGGYYYWDNFTAVNKNGINFGEYDNLRLSGTGYAKYSIRINDLNNNGCTYLISILEEIKL